ncbi:uncharacterized protein GIQ15_06677 [Arthroderma uncinatum]|uniref:uncharacterized protein n=1 Tax=Arthroderma uncinatum TaxID=74035 RepID=UPI00144A5D79|nr:uncharacterized protein GIQ15_06677 [Arthroderma uncinatum]KAF3479701.1 hypothetical protein GIQ15_06677 [Arthroderma uncinatum]
MLVTADLTLALGGLVVAVLILYVTARKWQRLDIHKCVKGPLRGYLSSSYPPSAVQEKEPAPSPQYQGLLPPLRREFLQDIRQPICYQRIRCPPVTEEQVKRSILPMESNYMLCNDIKYTPTGFSTEDIKALGDFPDYATLSGVPLPEPYPEFDIAKAIPRPYRPFRWNYHQTMSLARLDTNWWLELENTYKERVAERMGLYRKCGKEVLDYLPGSELACKELMEMSLQFLCARYPHYFSLSRDKRFFNNGILGTVEDLQAAHPIEILMANIPEDFAIMLRDEKTGNYYLRAGATCSSLGWNLGTKMGLQLHEIHGPIPDYKEKMQFSMGRYFSKMPTDKPIQRGSWGLEVDMPLYMPPGDPHELLRLSQSPDLKLSDCYLRVDWQSLRRLPLSGAIVFNYRAVFTPVSEFKDEPGIPGLLVKILEEAKKSIMEYKSTWHVEHVVLPAFKQWAKEQEESGLVEKDWNVCTLEESPYFKGWEEKWHHQQGF